MSTQDVLITIRRMTEEDTQAVAEIEAQVFSEPWSQASFADACANESYCYLTALYEDRVVGYAGCTVVCEDADVTNIAVNPAFRRLGIARKLLEVMKEQIRKQGATALFLEVRESNLPAQRLYETEGFLVVGRRKNFYRFPDEDALLMCAKLS